MPISLVTYGHLIATQASAILHIQYVTLLLATTTATTATTTTVPG